MNRLLSVAALLAALVAGEASAGVIIPTANFTLRSSANAGPATGIDAVWGDSGFQGFVTNLEGSQVDRTYLEYGLAGLGGPVASATLDFTLSGDASNTIFLGTYAANGIAEFAEWSTVQSLLTSLAAASGSYSIDVTAAVNASLGGTGFIGFGFSIDPHPYQAFLDFYAPPQLSFSTNGVPEPGTLLLAALGFAALRRARRRCGG